VVSLLVLTDRRQARRRLEDVVAGAVEGGARLVVLRERDLPDEQRLILARRLAAALAEVSGSLIVAGRLPGWDGPLHLSAVDRFPLAKPPLVGRSCHNATELAAAAAEGADYATLSPVFPTASKPGYGPALGLAGLAELCAAAHLPVYALGGLSTRDDVVACRAAGASGVAVLGAIMRAGDPATTAKELLP
jgi:thiamine-phosphate pyrophosphorylase